MPASPPSVTRARQLAKAIIRDVTSLEQRLIKTLPGIETASRDDDAFGEVWVGIGQVRAHAEQVLSASDFGVERLIRAATGRVRTRVPADNIQDDLEFELRVFEKVGRPSVSTIADELGWSEEEVRQKVSLHPKMRIIDGDQIDCEGLDFDDV